MHATSLLTLVLGATAVSAAALNAKRACDPYCNFPANGLDCPQNGGVQLSRDEVISAARGADRSGPPRENSASNLATSHCSSEAYNGVPLWTTDLPKSAGSLFYARARNGTFYFCGTSSGRTAQGWASSCAEK